MYLIHPRSACSQAVHSRAKYGNFKCSEVGPASASDRSPKGRTVNWSFLDSWEDYLPWRPEFHKTITLFSDSSGYKWGGVIHTKEGNIEVGDYWQEQDRGHSIMVKEAKALLAVLRTAGKSLLNSKVDAGVDNQPVIDSWNAQGRRCRELNDTLK